MWEVPQVSDMTMATGGGMVPDIMMTMTSIPAATTQLVQHALVTTSSSASAGDKLTAGSPCQPNCCHTRLSRCLPNHHAVCLCGRLLRVQLPEELLEPALPPLVPDPTAHMARSPHSSSSSQGQLQPFPSQVNPAASEAWPQ